MHTIFFFFLIKINETKQKNVQIQQHQNITNSSQRMNDLVFFRLD